MTSSAAKTSTLLREIVASCQQGGTITVGEFLNRLGERSFCLAILVFALLTLVAGIIPGFSTVAGVPIILMGLQMAVGMEAIWLPKKLADKEIPMAALNLLVSKALPHLIRIEKLLKPRWLWVSSPLGERFIALNIVAAAAVLSMPIPGGNFLPSLSISILALALLERDGVFLLIALMTGVGVVIFMYELIKAAAGELFAWVGTFF